jgi:hypothetical protein
MWRDLAAEVLDASAEVPAVQEPELGEAAGARAREEGGVKVQSYRVIDEEDVRIVAEALRSRLKLAGRGASVTISDLSRGELADWHRRYRKLVDLISESVVERGSRYSPRVWHVALKEMYLIPDELRLPSGATIWQTPSTARMSAEERDEYLEKVMDFAASHGIFLERQEETA